MDFHSSPVKYGIRVTFHLWKLTSADIYINTEGIYVYKYGRELQSAKQLLTHYWKEKVAPLVPIYQLLPNRYSS